MNILPLVVVFALLASGGRSVAAEAVTRPAEAAENAGPFPGITLPSDQRKFSLKISDVVKSVPVKHGDKVKVGQELLVLDDAEEQINMKMAEHMAAAAKVAIEAAKVTRENKLVELQRFQQMGQAASAQELARAELEAKLADLEIKRAEQEHEQRVQQVARQKEIIRRMRIMSELEGVVADIAIKAGEVLDPTKPAILVVKNNPLWVNVYLPVQVALALKKQEDETKAAVRLKIHFTDTGEQRIGTIIFYNPVAESDAGMQLVRLEVPNTEGKPAGLKVNVELPPVKPGDDLAVKQAQ